MNPKITSGLKPSGAIGLIAVGLMAVTLILKIGIEGVLHIDTGYYFDVPLILEAGTALGASIASSSGKHRKK